MPWQLISRVLRAAASRSMWQPAASSTMPRSMTPPMEDTLRSSVEAWMAQADETTLECLREGREAVGIAAAETSPKVRRARRCWQMPGNPQQV